MIPLEYELVLSVLIFAIGLYGVMTRKNAVVVLLSIEIILSAAMMNFVAFGAYMPHPSGQVYALVILGVAGAEAAIGVAIFLALYKSHGTIELDQVKLLRW